MDSDDYLLRCQRYIELNPVRAGMVTHPAEYRWSSFRANAMGPLLLTQMLAPLLGKGKNAKKAGAVGGLGKTDYNFEWDAKIYDSHDWAGRKTGQPFFMQVQLAGGKLRGGNDAAAQARAE